MTFTDCTTLCLTRPNRRPCAVGWLGVRAFVWFSACVHTSIIISDVTIGLVTLPAPSGGPSPAPASLGQRRWRHRLREAGRANAGPHQQQRPPHHHFYSPVPPSTDDKMKYLTAGHRESYSLVARK
uniref:Uncharacterized protein n=1 Tax=Anopheles maculatus TaxID=74869 RepID=A0A182TCH0_9DIPT